VIPIDHRLAGLGGAALDLVLAARFAVVLRPARVLILSTTFAVVVFSIVVQGLTFGRVAHWQATGKSLR
jgi:NhaP-type Na+/H+ or K+/H+ antiporter